MMTSRANQEYETRENTKQLYKKIKYKQNTTKATEMKYRKQRLQKQAETTE